MSRNETFLWHDYETFGANPWFDRPAQFAAQRTNMQLEPIADPVSWYCAPADDVLPHPAACLITGITPQQALARGMVETEFASHILAEMAQPGTCSAGYNSIRFDDVFTRNLLYRNLRDAYEREYRNGNSRWDLIDLARMCYALRPDGINWPMRSANGDSNAAPSFRLEELTAANGIAHADAHEALSDVNATIALARLLKNAQPRLFDWALEMRDQKTVMNLLDPVNARPIVHTSARIPATRGCTTLVLPLAVLPDRPKSVVVFDLMGDPAPLLQEPPDAIADRVFTPSADMPDGIERLPLKVVHSNHVPMVAPAATLQDADTDRIGLDPQRCLAHAKTILGSLASVRPKVIEVFSRPFADSDPDSAEDPDQMLYSGGFFSPGDKFLMRKVLEVPAAELPGHVWSFSDARLPLMLFRYRARNFPHTLTPAEREAWDQDRSRRLIQPATSGQLDIEQFHLMVRQAREENAGDSRAQRILDQLESWVQECGLQHLWEQYRAEHA